MRILLAEDDPLLGDALRAGLRQAGCQVDWVRDGAAAERELRAEPYAAAVLDLGLPRRDGLDVLASVRRAGVTLPVLVLTARDAVPDRIRGLDLGADDYVVKPVDLDELAARLRALVRRAHGQADATLHAGGVTLDPAARTVTLGGAPVGLSTREFDLLHALMLDAGRVLSREQLEQRLYGWGTEVDSNAVEVHVHHLRRKLGAGLIQTVRGVGYLLSADGGTHVSTPSLARRLLVLVMALVGLTWLGAAVYTWIDVRHELDELFDGHLAQAAALLVVQAADFHEDDDDEVPESPVLHRYAPRVAFQVFHEDRLVRRSANAPVQPMVAAGARTDHGFARVRIAGEPWRVFVARGAESDVRVYVGEHEHARGAVLRAVLRGTLWPLALALPVLALAVAWGVHGGLAPLRRLGRTLAARAPGDVTPVGAPDAPTEMRPMLDALDGLFTRIATLIDGERRFTADAAHELRTPIAAIRAQAQVAGGARDDAERRHALQSVLAGCDRATRLVAQLLVLARVESTGVARADGTPTDLAALARRTVADLAPAALARQQTLGLESPATCLVPADETLLGVLLRNLVDNALRYSPPGAEVRVALATDGTLTVEDGGPGLDADARAHLGQRFYRADTATASGAAGSGLGWSIVRRIAERERLAIEVDASPALGGLRVRVTPRQNS